MPGSLAWVLNVASVTLPVARAARDVASNGVERFLCVDWPCCKKKAGDAKIASFVAALLAIM